ncbi:tyrosine-type recombinase/integrase [Caulobacter hibisci]|uniref:Integrase arm-type DNA-binding domain-containing protein n=1 Tax=Caulobacter hibisci TaxID=2035993 RepID=A0ABS0T0C1_9CAUL|nr:site-specific integrase [Caulobacter hibisci]MBI1685139.1 integrase arm-type DNA-binding domain-containing protein [Caulobacter hibisci]
MAKVTGKLNPKTVAGALKPGYHGDGGNLYLVVKKSGSKAWAFIYRWHGREIEKGFGRLQDVSLAQARERAAAARTKLAQGDDPFARDLPMEIPTFGDFADEVAATLSTGFRNAKHREQWKMSLTKHARKLREMPIDQVDAQDVVTVLKPIWTKTPEAADRTRLRIERVLDAAAARGFRNRDQINPASWKGNLKHLLPARQKLSRGHHVAMAHASVGQFVADLRMRGTIPALALEFLILTAARSGEVFGATWGEIHDDVWVVPRERMKAGREHRVPLSAAALDVLERVGGAARKPSALIFANGRRYRDKAGARPLGINSLSNLMGRMTDHHFLIGGKRRAATPHGFRSSFRDWAGSETEYPREIAEEALAHLVGNAVERAYRRNDALKRRRVMMEDWAAYIGGSPRGSEGSSDLKAA